LRLIVLGWYGGANLTWLTRMDVVGYRPEHPVLHMVVSQITE
jgi:hypothetical protein